MLLQLDKLCTEYFICMVKNDGGTTALWLSWPDNIIWITNAGVCLAWIVQARLNNWSSVKRHRFKHVPTCTLKMVTGLCNWSLESPTPFCSMVVKQAWYLTLNLGQHSSFLLNCDTVCLCWKEKQIKKMVKIYYWEPCTWTSIPWSRRRHFVDSVPKTQDKFCPMSKAGWYLRSADLRLSVVTSWCQVTLNRCHRLHGHITLYISARYGFADDLIS